MQPKLAFSVKLCYDGLLEVRAAAARLEPTIPTQETI
jgi:hypothetical protein